MFRNALVIIVLGTAFVGMTGCRQPAGGSASRTTLFNWNGSKQNLFSRGKLANRGNDPLNIQAKTPEDYQRLSELAAQINTLNQRLGSFDSDNQQLLAEVAGLKQKLQVANDYTYQLKQQLADNATQLQQMAAQRQTLQQQLAALQSQTRLASNTGGTPAQLVGGATLRANNSLMQKLSRIQVPGGQARMDGDVIRIEFPTELLFVPGTYKIRPEQMSALGSLVTTLRQHFPRQIIGIEAHWDGTPLNPPTTTPHQLTATQALAVFNALSQLGLPADQLFTMAMGNNRPRHSQSQINGVHPNRRVEIVIYPETNDAEQSVN